MVGGNDDAAKRQCTGRARVLGDETFKAEIKGRTRRRLDAHVGHHAGDDKPGDPHLMQVVEQWGFPETVGIMLLKNYLVLERLNSSMDPGALCAADESGGFRSDVDVLDEDDRAG